VVEEKFSSNISRYHCEWLTSQPHPLTYSIS